MTNKDNNEKEDDMGMFDKRLASWLKSVQKFLDDYYQKNFSNLSGTERLVVEMSRGRRYVKVFTHRPNTDGYNQCMVFAFIDTTNGDILKPATWKAPAKTARGNLFNADDGMDCVTPHGIKYLK